MPATMSTPLQTIPEVQAAIAAGEPLFLAGSRRALSQLPRGNWVGGTISYFMSGEGGLYTEDRIFVTPIPPFAFHSRAEDYGHDQLAHIYRDAPVHGFTFLVLPAGTKVHQLFAQQAPLFEGFLLRPVVGWVTGVPVDRIGIEAPAVFNGRTGAVLEDRCAALHVALPPSTMADLDTVNIFESAGGAVIRFSEVGFRVSQCRVDGKTVNLADYITEQGISTEIPLIGDYNGSSINVSFQSIDPVARTVDLYAPVFPGVDYRFAKPVLNYEQAFARQITAQDAEPYFACNCILNYLHGHLEGKKTGSITGPITFGEIAHQLLNQTMVRLYLRDIG